MGHVYAHRAYTLLAISLMVKLRTPFCNRVKKLELIRICPRPWGTGAFGMVGHGFAAPKTRKRPGPPTPDPRGYALGAGSSRATTSSLKPIRFWAPSQNGASGRGREQ